MMPQSLAPSPQCHPRFSGEISALVFELVYLGPEDRRDSYAARKEGHILGCYSKCFHRCYRVFVRSGC